MAIVARTLDAHDQLPGSLAETRARIALPRGRGDRRGRRPHRRAPARAGGGARPTEALGGPVDILVNNAAAAIYTDVATMPLKRRRLMFEANVHAPVDLAQAVIPPMTQAGAGWIVNLTSGSADPWDGPPFELGVTGSTITVYGASKAALRRITNGLAAELHGTGVRVNAVEPRAAVHERRSRGAGGRQAPRPTRSSRWSTWSRRSSPCATAMRSSQAAPGSAATSWPSWASGYTHSTGHRWRSRLSDAGGTVFDLTGRTALVTGAGQNVGAGIARSLAAQGATVVVNDLRRRPGGGGRRREIDSVAAHGAMASAFDVTDHRRCASMPSLRCHRSTSS